MVKTLPKKYFCPACLKRYCYDYGLKRHLINKHNVPSDINIDDSYRLDADKKVKPNSVIQNKTQVSRTVVENNDVFRKKESDLHDYLICPITQQIYCNPVIAKDGITYEKDAILEWLKNNKTSPVTRKKIPKILYPNITIKNIRDIFIQNNPQYISDQYKPKML